MLDSIDNELIALLQKIGKHRVLENKKGKYLPYLNDSTKYSLTSLDEKYFSVGDTIENIFISLIFAKVIKDVSKLFFHEFITTVLNIKDGSVKTIVYSDSSNYSSSSDIAWIRSYGVLFSSQGEKKYGEGKNWKQVLKKVSIPKLIEEIIIFEEKTNPSVGTPISVVRVSRDGNIHWEEMYEGLCK